MDKFEIHFDSVRRRLHWTLRGFWSVDDVAVFGKAMLDVVGALGPPPQRYDSLCDASQYPVQSSEVSIGIGEIDRITATMRIGRVAIIVASMINKKQAERVLSREVRVFLSAAEALAWLDADEAS